MYNALFGFDNNAEVLLSFLHLTKEDFGRFRDCYFSKDGNAIIVYTRCGGGNREEYQEVFDKIQQHPNYIKDYDDDFDCTYASFEFSIPEQHVNDCARLFKDADTTTGAEKFDNLMKAMESDFDGVMANNERVRNVTLNLQSAFEDSNNKGGIIIIDPDGAVEKKDFKD